ncbi:uncharacterized protein LOC115674324 [Syzygium oleosum]|uniref:uncharacterized protein LOC115674324 n=1 Tax=Syzygium oleosum TaxID=219896 RepID=UPI0011D2099E|nr:uncharacterized protein LOC115674324 [Syzygium oleosum]
MVGGGSRRDEGSLVINNTNVFAALETLRKKKKSDKDKGSKSGKGSSKSAAQSQAKEPEPQVFWAPTPLKEKSWADVDDDDDDDYYATTAPPPVVWGKTPQTEEQQATNVEDTESEDDILDEGDDDLEEEHEHEQEQEQEVPEHPEPLAKKPAEVPAVSKETERQLSKKERKKKELAELEALLADFGVAPKENNGQDEPRDASLDKKDAEPDGEGEKKESAPGESKSAKKKKKKDKSSKETKEPQDQPNSTDVVNEPEVGAEQVGEDGSSVDIKERLKKMTSMKKKKSSKEMDAAAKAAAQEAAARSARLAAAKKKEKNHYNQQPVR